MYDAVYVARAVHCISAHIDGASLVSVAGGDANRSSCQAGEVKGDTLVEYPREGILSKPRQGLHCYHRVLYTHVHVHMVIYLRGRGVSISLV